MQQAHRHFKSLMSSASGSRISIAASKACLSTMRAIEGDALAMLQLAKMIADFANFEYDVRRI